MRFLFFLAVLNTISTAAQALTLDSDKVTCSVSDDIFVTACDSDGYHCNHSLKNLSKTGLSEFTSVKNEKVTVLELRNFSRTQWTSGASFFDIIGAKLEIDLSALPQTIKFAAMAKGTLTIYTVNGENLGIDSKKFNTSCTVISSRLLTCKTLAIEGTHNQLNLNLQAN